MQGETAWKDPFCVTANARRGKTEHPGDLWIERKVQHDNLPSGTRRREEKKNEQHTAT
jgi:hypothetical protein